MRYRCSKCILGFELIQFVRCWLIKTQEVKKSEKKYEDDDISIMPLGKLPDVTPYTKINCEVKILQANDTVKTTNGKKPTDCYSCRQNWYS